MEDTHLQTFEVSGFKKFTDLKVENIGQFNLIVGDNNVGKTTLLEALLINKNVDNFVKGLSNIIFYLKKFRSPNNPAFSHFFSESPNDSSHEMIFNLSFNKQDKEKIIFKTGRYNKINFNATGIVSPNNFYEMHEMPSYESTRGFDFNIPYIPFGVLYSHELTRQYSNHIQLYADRKKKLIDSLSLMIKEVNNIEVNASYDIEPILLIAEKGKNRLSPLATYGDGSVKFFRTLLSLFSNENYNRLMIDELDAGVHYSRLKGFIKLLFIIAKEQKKQIFATTHSKECIQYYKDALVELKEEENGKIIRLADTKSGIKAFTLGFEEFENALFAESEIR